ncbi:MAG: hypothetical protein K0S00_2973 [Xanthobacteraceae bacterium]|jgi:hypothetical protein|nr:hypothetical protein [Xanthobacteraceae bacterium]
MPNAASASGANIAWGFGDGSGAIAGSRLPLR